MESLSTASAFVVMGQIRIVIADCVAFNGFGLVIVRAKSGQTGTVTLQAAGEGLSGATLLLQSVTRD